MTAEFSSQRMSVLYINVSKGCTHGGMGTAEVRNAGDHKIEQHEC